MEKKITVQRFKNRQLIRIIKLRATLISSKNKITDRQLLYLMMARELRWNRMLVDEHINNKRLVMEELKKGVLVTDWENLGSRTALKQIEIERQEQWDEIFAPLKKNK